jgi:hypothetical protein
MRACLKCLPYPEVTDSRVNWGTYVYLVTVSELKIISLLEEPLGLISVAQNLASGHYQEPGAVV